MDRGYPSQKEFIELDRDGFKFLIGARASMSVMKKIIDDRNSDFYDQKYYLRNQRCYGVKDKCTVKREFRSNLYCVDENSWARYANSVVDDQLFLRSLSQAR